MASAGVMFQGVMFIVGSRVSLLFLPSNSWLCSCLVGRGHCNKEIGAEHVEVGIDCNYFSPSLCSVCMFG